MKSLFSGIALAAMAGMLMGGAMKPTLDLGDRPAGPQMVAGWSGTRSTGPFDDGMAFAGYSGKVPDYVLGTDMQKEVAWAQDAAPADEEPIEIAAAEIEARPVAFTKPTYVEPPREPVTYPSMAGGVDYAPQAPTAAEPAPAPVAASLG